MAGLCALLAIFSVSAAGPGVKLPEVEPRFVRFGAEHGLPTMINDLAVDRQGYVWVATADGLARYDGERFRFWRREVGVETSLPENDVTVLHVDAADRLWAATWYALTVLDPGRRTPRRISFDQTSERCATDITAMSSDRDGNLWLTTYAGVLCMIGPKGDIAEFTFPRDGLFDGGRPVALLAREDGSLLVGADNGLWRVRVTGRMLRSMRLHEREIGSKPVFALTQHARGMVWVGAADGLHLLDERDVLLPLPSPKKMSRLERAAVINSGDGSMWIGSYRGLYHYHHHEIIRNRLTDNFGFEEGAFRVALDGEGNLWVASYTRGLFRLPEEHPRFRISRLPFAEDSARLLSADFDPVGDIWVLGGNSVGRLPWGAGRFLRVASIAELGLEDPRTIRSCPDGKIVLADARGVVVFDPVTRLARRLFKLQEDDGIHLPETLDCDREGKIWLSIYGGGMVLLAPDGRVLQDFSPRQTLDAEAEAYIDLRFAPDGKPWYSDGKHLRRWDRNGFRKVPLPEGEYVYALAFASSNRIWVTRFGSIEEYRWDGHDLHLMRQVSSADGLPVAETRSVLASAGGQVWLNSVRGLVLYDTRAKRVRMFGLRDGLPRLDTTIDQLSDGPQGRSMVIAGNDLVLFDADDPLPAPRPSKLSIETLELRRNEDTVSFEDGAVTMRPGDRDLRVAARVMSFADPAAHRYRFRLRGYDPDWVNQGERGERVFSVLPPGDYLLEIQGANADGVWSPTRRIALTVEAPWWRRWWALLLYTLAASGLVWWLAYLDRMRLKRRHHYQLIDQKRALAEQASQAKSRFLANLGHEVRTPMTGVLGMSELLLSTRLDDRQQGQVWAIRRAGEHLLRLVNDALDLARIEAGRLELEAVDFPIDALIDDVVGLMRPLAERKALRFDVVLAEDARGGWRGDPTRIRQILLNLLGNAIKFTARGEVSLSIAALSPQGLRCTIRDTGPGLDAEQQRRLFRRFEQAEGARTASRYGGSGLGLAICQELAVAMGGGIEVSSAPGEGACFVVRLPIERAERAVTLPASAEARDAVARHVLLVEDDAIVADVLIGLLQAQRHRPVHAGHALAALTANATQAFDLALIDLDLPGMDGLALARQLRAQGFDRPMIAITARADGAAEPEAMAAGFDAFLRKPLTGELLADAIAARFVPVA
jgi:signal transduction histidine kinase/CheY-like chemotaxis protein/streptogramin lyase